MSDYLIHYGVLGMKWGVRKDNYTFLKEHAKYSGSERSKDTKKIRNYEPFKKAATSKKMSKLAGRVNSDYDDYLKKYTKDWSSKETKKASDKHTKSANKLRKESQRNAKKLLGIYGSKKLTYVQALSDSGKEFLSSASAKRILTQTLIDVSLNEAKKK